MTAPTPQSGTTSETTTPVVPRGTRAPLAAPAPIAPADFSAVLGWEFARCDSCPADFHRSPGSGRTTCPECVASERERKAKAGLEAEGQALLAAADRIMPGWLASAGMNRRESDAQVGLIRSPLARQLYAPDLGVRDMLAGQRPERGFGLSGGVGVGKTFALAAIMKLFILARWKMTAAVEGSRAIRRSLAWVRWPEEVSDMRTRAATREHGMHESAERIAELSRVEYLVLDDMGAERMRGPYDEDWAASQLDLLIDRRYNQRLPTWYTTNLAPSVFVERFGSRLYSRLCGHNPLIEVQSAPDLRITGR